MPITTPYVPLSYAGDGVTNAFPVTWQYQLQTDLVVSTLNTTTNTTTLLVLGTDYTVSPTLNSPANTGTVVTTTAIPALTDLLIERSVPLTQETTWVPNDPNLSTSTMNAVDKLTEIAQQLSANPFGLTGTSDQFLRGDNVLTNTLIGALGTPVVPADTSALFIAGQNANASIKVVSGSTSQGAFSFGTDGSANPWDMRWVFDPQLQLIGSQAFGGPINLTIDGSGNLDTAGQVSATTLAGNLDGAFITGTIAPSHLGSGSGSGSVFLNGLGQFTIPAGGGGGVNTTTTGTFTIAAVLSSQTVPVTSTTGIVVGTQLQISDGTHIINGHVTNIASLNLTFVTDAIQLGIAGNTMASGAAVQGSTFPGTNSVLVLDGSTSPAPATTLQFFSDESLLPVANKPNVDLYLQAPPISGGVAELRGICSFIDYSRLRYSWGNGINSGPASVPYFGHNASAALLAIANTDGAVLFRSGSSAVFGLLTDANITTGSLTPPLLKATNSPSAGQVPSYADSTHFTWVANNTLPANTNSGKFLNGLGAYTNILDLSTNSSGDSPNRMMLSWGITDGSFGSAFSSSSDGTLAQWSMQKRISGSWDGTTGVVTNYLVGSTLANNVLSVGALATTIDSVQRENIQSPGIIRTNTGLRDVYGPLHKIYPVDMTGQSGTFSLDLVNGAFQRLTGFTNDVTLTLTDTTPLPSNSLFRYESELTLEIDLVSSIVNITWAASGGTIVWANGASAPTLTGTGKFIVKFIRSQDQTYWIGQFMGTITGTGTVTSVASGSGLTGGPITTTGTLSIAAGGVVNSMIAAGAITNTNISASANISPSKIAGSGASTTTFLRNDGAWAVPAGGGGGGPTLAGTQTWTGVNSYTNAGNGWNANFGSPYNASSVIANIINNAGPTGAPDGLSVYVTNATAKASSANVQACNFWQTLTHPGAGMQNVQNVLNIVGNADGSVLSSSFYLNLTAETTIRQFNSSGSASDSLWFTSCSPDTNYSSTPDADGITHTFTGGFVRIGEVNYGNAWGDFGIGLTLAGAPGGRSVSGLWFIPDVITGAINDSTPLKFNTTWGVAIGSAAADHLGNIPKNWVGLLIDEDGIVGKNDHGSIIGGGSAGNSVGGGGYGIHLNGSSSSGNPIGKGINMANYMDIGLDISGATCTQTGTNCPSGGLAIAIAQNQAIKLGTNTFLYYDGTNLKVVLNGVVKTVTVS